MTDVVFAGRIDAAEDYGDGVTRISAALASGGRFVLVTDESGLGRVTCYSGAASGRPSLRVLTRSTLRLTRRSRTLQGRRRYANLAALGAAIDRRRKPTKGHDGEHLGAAAGQRPEPRRPSARAGPPRATAPRASSCGGSPRRCRASGGRRAAPRAARARCRRRSRSPTCGFSPFTMWISVKPVSSRWRTASSTSSSVEIV